MFKSLKQCIHYTCQILFSISALYSASSQQNPVEISESGGKVTFFSPNGYTFSLGSVDCPLAQISKTGGFLRPVVEIIQKFNPRKDSLSLPVEGKRSEISPIFSYDENGTLTVEVMGLKFKLIQGNVDALFENFRTCAFAGSADKTFALLMTDKRLTVAEIKMRDRSIPFGETKNKTFWQKLRQEYPTAYLDDDGNLIIFPRAGKQLLVARDPLIRDIEIGGRYGVREEKKKNKEEDGCCFQFLQQLSKYLVNHTQNLHFWLLFIPNPNGVGQCIRIEPNHLG